MLTFDVSEIVNVKYIVAKVIYFDLKSLQVRLCVSSESHLVPKYTDATLSVIFVDKSHRHQRLPYFANVGGFWYLMVMSVDIVKIVLRN